MRTDLENYFLDILINSSDESSGDMESPTGYFALAHIPAAEVPEKFSDLIGEDGHANLVISQSSQGFVYGYNFMDHDSAVTMFKRLEDNYDDWFDGDADWV